MSKDLADMPDEVRASAWCNDTRWRIRPLHWIDTGLTWAVLAAVQFAYWVPAYWILIANLPIDAITDGIPRVRNFIVWSYLGWGALAVAAHWYSLMMSIPRKDRGYPVLSEDIFALEAIRNLSYHVVGFAILLGLAWAMKSHGSRGQWDHALSASIMSALGAGLAWYSFRPLHYGLRVPTEGEVYASMRTREQRLLTPPSAQPHEEYTTPVLCRPAEQRFGDIFGMQAVKEKLLAPAEKIVAERRPDTEAPRNGILLHGEPGNGKSVFAEALAGELGVPFVELTYGQVSSKWVGEMPRVISNCFTYARRNAPCVFFIDEIDSFIRSRDEYSNNSEEQKITNTLLTELVSLRKHQVVLVAATNHLGKLDAAAIREGRFDYKVEITPPDEPARIGLLSHGASRHAGNLHFDEAAMASIAKRWRGFSASRLMAVVKALPGYAAERQLTSIGYNDWIAALRTVQGREGRVPEHAKTMAELILDAHTREALQLVTARLKDVSRIESMGGALPSGVLFYGPSGTGKTAAARAMAKECGWSFLSIAGPDLIADREKISKLYAQAKDIRPAVIFIDEADDVLRSRQLSSTPDLTNRLLILMDGVEDRVPDVVFIAATNHPEQIDPALLRAGRFTEKVEFLPPPLDAVPGFIRAWLDAKGLSLDGGLDVLGISHRVEGETIANIEGILQYALNRAIERQATGNPLALSIDDVTAAVRVVSTGRTA